MKKFIIKTLLWLLPIIVLTVSTEYLLRQIPNDYSYKKKYLDENSEKIQILILGSSGSAYGINPVYFSQNTFNASHMSQTFNFDFKIFSKYKDKFNDLRIIILPVSYPSLWVKLEAGVESWRVKDYTIYYGMNPNSLSDYSEFLTHSLSFNFKRLYKYYFEKKDNIFCSKFGWEESYISGYTFGYDMEKTGVKALSQAVDIYSKDRIKIFEENIQILNSFAEFCTQKNVKLIFLTPPAYYTYRENLHEDQLNKMLETMNDFVEKHNNCYYFNWIEDTDFTKEDYYDADHLNGLGAEKLSKKLDLYIDSLETVK